MLTTKTFAQTSLAHWQVNYFKTISDRDLYLPHQDKPSYSNGQAVAQLMGNAEFFQDLDGNGKVDIIYEFLSPQYGPRLANLFDLDGFTPFNSQQQEQVRLSLQSWSDVANVNLRESFSGGGDGHLYFGNYGAGDNAAGAAFNQNFFGNSDQTAYVWVRADETSDINKTPDLNNYARHTLTHETGHALGLDHPGDYNADASAPPSYQNDAEYVQDTAAHSVMSYWPEGHAGHDFNEDRTAYLMENYSPFGLLLGAPTAAAREAYMNYFYPVDHLHTHSSAPLVDDIAAIQQLYGANMNTRVDDTTYGFNSNTGRDFLSITSSADKPVFAVWDAGGNDTLDFSGYHQNQSINLNELSFSDVGGLTGNVSIARGVTLENAIGGSGDDLMVGNLAANELKGGAGDDLLYGSAGGDRLWGGAGKDTFLFIDALDSPTDASDRIMDFVSGEDKIDLSGITGGTALNFVSGLTGKAGDAVLAFATDTGLGTLEIDFSGTGKADFLVTTVGRAATTDIVV
ncbi:M10 family metallopeptidase C-terminal domain-containing protein [Pseudomonas gingeri]|uniref:M10 family metallopeptidase C-terminal domain-containing protein n=1 Tax=Pseudomonas gingeri TaxID=117681 RepID=A0A7Y8CJV3_9PSED|nr:M10 family metallopeptidase C-terminal domain-containing protein [Pseudomonas gingeri]NWB26851.1 M10 family metallopeptidase C-terminal domain-containing protein [Pseudomonas gingeri]NWC32599.1 M10 family metallopeptidase C-terminal domain-containing protein [Pseudomonas gingeri]